MHQMPYRETTTTTAATAEAAIPYNSTNHEDKCHVWLSLFNACQLLCLFAPLHCVIGNELYVLGCETKTLLKKQQKAYFCSCISF